MRWPKLKEGDIIHITAYDAFSHSQEWVEADEHEDIDLLIEAVGFFKSKDRNYIRTFGIKGRGDSQSLSNGFDIPRKCLKTIKIMK